jgi:HlyD family secretion protein
MTATADITVNKAENVLVVPNAALRFAPKTETSAAQTRKGSILSKLFPHRPHERTTKVREEMGSTVRTQTVWILSNDKPEPVKVTTGLTDGTKTQVLRGNIKAGTALLVDMETGQQ